MKRILPVLFLFVAASVAEGATFTLTDKNSTAQIETEAQSGMFNWLVDGQDQVFQQWFWFRVGNTAEQSIDVLPSNANASNTDFDPGNETLSVQYLGSGFTIEIQYSLLGGSLGSNTADIAETIAITNTSGSALDFHFFQYSDFDLGANASPDTVSLVNANTVSQIDSGAGLVFSETVVVPSPTHFELDHFANTRTRLNDGFATILDDDPTSETGDVTWAFQWDATIAASGAGSTFIISKDKRLAPVPEPATLAIWGAFGLAGLATARRRKQRS
jgi:hypothetical protein